MPWLLRLLAIPVALVVLRAQGRSQAGALIKDIEKLSTNQRLKLTWALVQDNRVPLFVRPLLVLPAVYIASPIDLVPDFIPVIGRIDDRFVSSTTYSLLARFVPPTVLREHIDRAGGSSNR